MHRRTRTAVQSVTGARTGLTEDLNARTRRYLISMGIRTVCLVGAVVTSGPLRWVLVAAAVALPYLAVVVANAGRERAAAPPPSAVLPVDRPALGPGRPTDEAR
jgi:hypothetical protein